jgi:galactokinase
MTDSTFSSLEQSIVCAPMADVGYGQPVIDRFVKLQRDAHRALDEAGAATDGRRTWIAPGRIEVLGKHVDYAGGRSLLCAVERGIVVVVAPRDDRTVILRDARRREALVVPLEESLYPSTQAPLPWSVYPRTVVRRLQRNFDNALVGADIALASNLPPAAGVSSSSALVVGLTLALSAISDLHADPRWAASLVPRTKLAGYIGAMENGLDFGALSGDRGVGTLGGAQDQTAILCSTPAHLNVFGWAPVTHERTVPWPQDYTFVIAVSGVVAAKTGAAKNRYNRVARTAHHLVHAWNAQGGTAGTLADAFREAAGGEPINGVPHALARIATNAATDEFSATQLASRLEQFQAETWHHVPVAAEAIAQRDWKTFADVVVASQRGAEVALENQIAETMRLVIMARELGAVAASAFGAGFGGSIWAMIPVSEAESFMTRLRERYVKQFPQVAHRMQIFQTQPSAPAFEVIASR